MMKKYKLYEWKFNKTADDYLACFIKSSNDLKLLQKYINNNKSLHYLILNGNDRVVDTLDDIKL